MSTRATSKLTTIITARLSRSSRSRLSSLQISPKRFVIRVKTVAETPSGLYKATVNLKDSEGNIVKTATVYTCVWDLTLSDETACATSFNLDKYTV